MFVTIAACECRSERTRHPVCWCDLGVTLNLGLKLTVGSGAAADGFVEYKTVAKKNLSLKPFRD